MGEHDSERGEHYSMKKYDKDLVTGIVILVFAVCYRLTANGIQVFRGIGATVISARTIPYMWSYILMVLAGAVIVRSILGIRASGDAGEGAGEKAGIPLLVTGWIREHITVLGTFAVLAAYAVCLKPVGYLISSCCYLPLQVMLLTEQGKRKKSIPAAVIESVLFTVISYYIFVKLLSINLPKGLWGF